MEDFFCCRLRNKPMVTARTPGRPSGRSTWGNSSTAPAKATSWKVLPHWDVVAKIIVRLVEPVFARRIEDIKVERVFQRPGFVRHVGGYTKHFPGSHDNLFSIDRKFQRAFHDVRHFFMVGLVLRGWRAFFHNHAG